MLKRQQRKESKEALAIIQKNISTKFRRLKLESVYNIPDLADIILSKGCITVAKLCDDSKTIHLKIESIHGFVYEAFTEDYKWFLETFSFL